MKLRYIISSIFTLLAVALSCTKVDDSHLSQVQVSKSYVAFPVEGGSVDVIVNATADWAINDIPEWLTVSPAAGHAGETTVTFSASETSKTNEARLHLVCNGATQIINVMQVAEKVELPLSTCAEVNAAEDGPSFRIKGTVTSIENTTYGNMYIEDETGSVYVYGTLYEGAEKQFSKHGIEVGDIVTVEGPRGSYKGSPQLVNVTVIDIEKSLIKIAAVDPENASLPIEGGTFTVELSVKGDGVAAVIPDDAKSWLSVQGIALDGTLSVVVFKAAENPGGDRSTTITFVTKKGDKDYTAVTTLTQAGAIIETTIDNILAAEDGNTQYRVTGYVSKVDDLASGKIYIKDAKGEIYLYKVSYGDFTVKAGDIITVVGKKGSYNGTPQIVSAAVENRLEVKDIDVASFKALADDAETWYRLKGKVIKSTETGAKFDLETYGNFGLQDATGDVYVYGVVPGWGGASKQFATLGVKEGDVITIVAHKGSYKGVNQATSAFYVSHEAGETPEEPGEPETPASNVITFTPEQMPEAYPKEAAEFTIGTTVCEILNVAYFEQYSTGIQMKKGGSYILTKSSVGKIKSIKLYNLEGKTWDKDRLTLYVGTDANPATVVAISSADENSSVYEITGDYTHFKLLNDSQNAVNMEKIEITVE